MKTSFSLLRKQINIFSHYNLHIRSLQPSARLGTGKKNEQWSSRTSCKPFSSLIAISEKDDFNAIIGSPSFQMTENGQWGEEMFQKGWSISEWTFLCACLFPCQGGNEKSCSNNVSHGMVDERGLRGTILIGSVHSGSLSHEQKSITPHHVPAANKISAHCTAAGCTSILQDRKKGYWRRGSCMLISGCPLFPMVILIFENENCVQPYGNAAICHLWSSPSRVGALLLQY